MVGKQFMENPVNVQIKAKVFVPKKAEADNSAEADNTSHLASALPGRADLPPVREGNQLSFHVLLTSDIYGRKPQSCRRGFSRSYRTGQYGRRRG